MPQLPCSGNDLKICKKEDQNNNRKALTRTDKCGELMEASADLESGKLNRKGSSCKCERHIKTKPTITSSESLEEERRESRILIKEGSTTSDRKPLSAVNSCASKSIMVKLLEKNKQNENNSRQLQDEIKKLEILETEFEVLRLENQQMTKTIEDLKKRFHDLEKFNQENIMKRDDLTKTVGRLSKEVVEKDNKVKLMVKSLNNKTTKSETKISELTKKVSDLEKDCNSESQENSERQASLRLREGERLERENAGLEEELKKTNYQCALRPSITFQKHFDLLSDEVAGHQHLISKLENSTQHLEVQMNEVKPMLGYLEEELQKQVAEKLCLRQDVCLSEAEKANLLVKIGRLKQRVEAAEDSEDRLKVAFKEEMSIYKEKLREFQEAVEKSQKSEEDLNQLNRQTEEENKECQIRIVELEEVIRDLETENSKLRSSNDYLKKEMAKKEEILESVNLR